MDHVKAYEAGIKYYENGNQGDVQEALESFAIWCSDNGIRYSHRYMRDVRDGWESAAEGCI